MIPTNSCFILLQKKIVIYLYCLVEKKSINWIFNLKIKFLGQAIYEKSFGN